jgi:hypothetical protein
MHLKRPNKYIIKGDKEFKHTFNAYATFIEDFKSLANTKIHVWPCVSLYNHFPAYVGSMVFFSLILFC